MSDYSKRSQDIAVLLRAKALLNLQSAKAIRPTLSARITAALGDSDWVIVHAGSELLAGSDIDEREVTK